MRISAASSFSYSHHRGRDYDFARVLNHGYCGLVSHTHFHAKRPLILASLVIQIISYNHSNEQTNQPVYTLPRTSVNQSSHVYPHCFYSNNKKSAANEHFYNVIIVLLQYFSHDF